MNGAITTEIHLDADAIKKELHQYGALKRTGAVRTVVIDTGNVITIDADHYFKMFTLKRVVKYAQDISSSIRNAID